MSMHNVRFRYILLIQLVLGQHSTSAEANI